MLQRLYSLPLRVHLLFMALLLALPALALILHSGKKQYDDALKKGYSEARRLAGSIAKEQYNLTGNVEQLLAALEQIPEIEHQDAAATNEILAGILKKNPQYANIIAADLTGHVWASGLPWRSGVSIRDRRSFQQVVRTRHFSSGDFGVGAISGKPSIGFGYPIITGSGRFIGVLAAKINFDHLNELLPASDLATGSSFSLIDCNGVIVDRSSDAKTHIGTRLRSDLFGTIQNGPEKSTFIDEATGEKRIISYRKMQLHNEKAPYLYICTSFPVRNIVDKAQSAMILNLGLLLPVLVLAVFSVFFLGNLFFVKRIERLQRAAEQMAEGDLRVRIGDSIGGGEIGRLGHAFDEMARKLAERRDSLVQSERELSELNQNLAKRVEEETDRRLSHERLLARHTRLMAMGEMIGAIAHQWRQPLATLGATIQSIRMAWEMKCLDADFVKRAEEDAQKQLYYMSDTIEDFRNFFRPEKVTETFEVKEKVHEVMMLVSSQFSHNGVSLTAVDDTGGVPLYIKGYQNEFKQSLLNLVSNAFDAIVEKESSTPAVGSGKGMVTIRIDGTPESVILEVVDNGCGIASDHAERVFDPYFTTKSADKGTGIGLYMTKLIIEESMGGSIGFQSGSQGTCFTIKLARDARGAEGLYG